LAVNILLAKVHDSYPAQLALVAAVTAVPNPAMEAALHGQQPPGPFYAVELPEGV